MNTVHASPIGSAAGISASGAARPRVALILDHPQRDLPGIVLLAAELCRRGVVCHLVPMNRQEHEVFSLAPDFVLLNFCRHGTEDFARRLLGAGIDFGLLDTEGAVYEGEIEPDGSLHARFENYTGLLWWDRELLRAARVACLWGPRLAEHLEAGGWFSRDQLVVTGCPRFDFYNARWKSVFAEPVPESSAPRFQLDTWYGTVNSRMLPVAENVKQLRALGWPDEKIARLLDAERGAIQGCIELARSLSRDFPQAEIVLRPHPFESDAVYRDALGSLGNVRVDGSGPIYPQICRSSLLIARGCTTAVEAAMAGLPVLSPRWIPTPSFSPMPESVSLACEDYAALRARAEEIVSGRYQRPAGLEEVGTRVIQDWFGAADGNAHVRVADAIVGRLDGARKVNERACEGFREESEARSRRTGFRSAIRRALGLPENWSFRRMKAVASPGRSAKRFRASDVLPLLERLDDASRRQSPGRADEGCEVVDGSGRPGGGGRSESVTM